MEEKIWEQLNLTDVNRLIEKMMPEYNVSFSDVAMALTAGHFSKAAGMLRDAFLQVVFPGMLECRSLFLSIFALGILSMFLSYSAGLVKSRQVADLAHYFIYLFAMLILLNGFEGLMATGTEAIETCRQFVGALIPAYCLSVSFSSGSVSAAVNYEFMLLLMNGTEYILAGLLLPLTSSYVFLAMLDGLDERHRMKEFMKLADRIISWGIKICLSVTLVLSGVQNLVAVQVDSVQKTVVQKTIAAIPGIGDMADSVTQVILGSAGLIKNSIGATALFFLFLLLIRPLVHLLSVSFAIKLAGACVRVMGQNLLSETISKVGNAGFLVLRITMCAVLIFYISIAMTMLVMKGG